MFRTGWAREECIGENRPKRRKTRRLGHNSKFFFFLSCLILIVVYRYYLYFKRKGWLRKAATMKTGPNNARRVVWAI